MKNRKHTSTNGRNQPAMRKGYGSYEEYLEAFLPRVEDVPIIESEDPSDFGSELAEVSLRKLEQRLTRN